MRDERRERGREAQESTHERYQELCALATTGTLGDDEWKELQAHLSGCPDCADLLQKYRDVARTGMPLLFSEESVTRREDRELWTPQAAKRELLARIARGEQVGWSSDAAIRFPRSDRRSFWSRFPAPNGPACLLYGTSLAALALLLAAAYGFGVGQGRQIARPSLQSAKIEESSLEARLEALEREKDSLDGIARARGSRIAALSKQVGEAAQRVAELAAAERQAEQAAQSAGAQLSQANQRSASAASARDALAKQLRDAETSLVSTKAALGALRNQRASSSSTAGLEARIADLSARLEQQEQLTGLDAQLLSKDRDIRELMGARDLYIADVYDVGPSGHMQKPFGRIFYTRDRSLIFYAFDLDKQRGVQEASTFQAWGRRGFHDAHPISLGIFYRDSQTKRRWVLRYDNPAELAQINSVFVTVEPKGGSRVPRGKPLLVASLLPPPNHP